jgi:hypothetical protein
MNWIQFLLLFRFGFIQSLAARGGGATYVPIYYIYGF